MKKILILMLLFFVMAGTVFAASKAGDKWMKKGLELYEKKDFIKAAEAFEKALAGDPKNTGAIEYAGYSYLYAGEKAKALEKLEAAYEKTGDKKLEAYIGKLKGRINDKIKVKDKVVGMDAGGAGRVAALGGAGIVLPDYANQTDLYSSGFTAAYPYRESKSVIYIVPYMNLYGNKTVADDANETTVENSFTGFGAGAAARAESLAVLNLTDNGFIILKPRLEMNPGTRTTSYPAGTNNPVSVDTGLNLLGADAEIAYKISKNLSAGALFGYDSYGSIIAERIDIRNKQTYDYTKMNYLGSISYLIPLDPVEISLAVSGGSRTPLMPEAPFAITGLDAGIDAEYARLVNRYEYHRTAASYFTLIWHFKNMITEDIVPSGFDLNFGAGLTVKDVFEISLTAGLTPGIAVKRRGTNITTNLDTSTVWPVFNTDEYDNYKDGMNLTGSLKARYFLSGLLDIGLKAGAMNLGITRIPNEGDDPISETITLFDLSAGATVKIGKALKIPVEGFFQAGSRVEKEPVAVTDETWAVNDLGFRTGVEYMITDDLAARIGFDLASGGGTHKIVDSGTITADNSPYGTGTNPGKSKIGVALGMGYRYNGFDMNIAGRYVISSESPLEAGLISRADSGLELTASVLAGF